MKTYASIGRQWVMRITVFLLTILLVLGSLGLGLFSYMNGYTMTQEECWNMLVMRIMESKNYNTMRELYQMEEYGVPYTQLSADFRGKGHYRYYIQRTNGTLLRSTMPNKLPVSDEDCDLTTKSVLYIHEYTNRRDTYYDIAHNDWYGYFSKENLTDDNRIYTITAYYAYDAEIMDVYTLLNLYINLVYPIRYALPWILIGMFILLFISVIRMTKHTGHRQYLPDHPLYRGDVVLSFFDRIPYDLYICVLGGLFLLCCLPLAAIGDVFRMDMMYLGLWLIFGLCAAMLFLVTAAYLTTITRIKARTLFSNTLVWRCILFLWQNGKRILQWMWKMFLRCLGLLWKGLCILGQLVKMPFRWWVRIVSAVPLFWQVALTAPVVIIAYTLLASAMWSRIGVFLLTFLVALGLYLVILYAAYSFRTLMESGKALAEGDLRYKTNLKHLMLCFRSHGENLNRIGEGMEIAVADKIKSERFKTELITNVSHDIKTPLTSIINYTDLLSREPLEGNAKEYVEVLSRQSARLKKLIEDLIEASKASTGNVTMAPEKLDVCQIVRQSLGEYAERMENAGLQLVQIVPDEPCFAMVDGRQLWRVFDNLYSNICKYAMPGTRVYVVTTAEADSVTVSMKNISRDVLSTAAEELTERFVQGDASRASEGSGLGLNIAKSLTELQKGTFRILCDGDLFRVDVSFPRI